LHAAKIYHRDLKPQNILVFSDQELKLADFGTAKEMSAEDELKTFTGTPGYLAPEVTREGNVYTGKVDIYSIGVILYNLLMTEDRPRKQGYVYLEADLDGPYSNELKLLALACLDVDPTKRPDIGTLLQKLRELLNNTSPSKG
jgi:serine/threonine protein kinase